MRKIKKILFFLIIFLNISTLVKADIPLNDIVYDKHLTGYKYFSKVQKFKFKSQDFNSLHNT